MFTTDIISDRKFWNFKLHVDFRIVEHSNSGIGLRGRYEIQILEDYGRPPGTHGAAALYSRIPPAVNASKPAGEWQSYDIIYHAPKPSDDGKTLLPGSFTVLHNGVLVQDHTSVKGEATTAAKFEGVAPKGPLLLQDHGNPVRYRNIWIRPLTAYDQDATLGRQGG